MYNHSIYFNIEQKYLQNYIQITLVFNISKSCQKRIPKWPHIFPSQNHIEICTVTSIFHLKCSKKYIKTTLVFSSSKSGQKKYIETTSIFCSSKFRRTKYDFLLMKITSKKSILKRHRFFTHEITLKNVHWNDVNFWPIEITSKRYVKMRCTTYLPNTNIRSTSVRHDVSVV